MKLFDIIQSKIELFRLEQRYTRRRDRRSTFISEATYVNGEYVYNVPKASQHTGGSSSSEGSKASTNTDTSARTSASTRRRESRMQRKRGNSLIMEVNDELERAEREQEMEVEDMVGKLAPLSPVGGTNGAGEPERKKKNRLSRISIREFRWDRDNSKGQ